MPRIYDAMSDPYDFCNKCFPSEAAALKRYGDNGREANQGPDGRGNCFTYDADHPPYSETDYRCHKCHKRLWLSDDDDWLPISKS